MQQCVVQQCMEEPGTLRHLVKALRMKEVQEEGWSHVALGPTPLGPRAHRKLTSTRLTTQETRVTIHMTHFCSYAGREFCPWLFSRPTPINIHESKNTQLLNILHSVQKLNKTKQINRLAIIEWSGGKKKILDAMCVVIDFGLGIRH